jgi:hypothetical protein
MVRGIVKPRLRAGSGGEVLSGLSRSVPWLNSGFSVKEAWPCVQVKPSKVFFEDRVMLAIGSNTMSDP